MRNRRNKKKSPKPEFRTLFGVRYAEFLDDIAKIATNPICFTCWQGAVYDRIAKQSV